MRVAALYDIHGNLPALEAVLHDLRRQGVDRIVVGGDVVPGPMSSETLDRVLDLGVPTDFIRGNGELAALAESAGAPVGVSQAARDRVAPPLACPRAAPRRGPLVRRVADAGAERGDRGLAQDGAAAHPAAR